MSNQASDIDIALKLTTMVVTAIHNLRAAGHTDDLDVEVSERQDCAEVTAVTTIRIKAKGSSI